MLTEIMRWAKFMTVLWPLIVSAPIFVFLVFLRRPLRQILERFNCGQVSRIRIGPLEIEKQSRSGRASAPRRTRRGSTR